MKKRTYNLKNVEPVKEKRTYNTKKKEVKRVEIIDKPLTKKQRKGFE